MLRIIADALVNFYRFWHGTLHLPGGGVLLRLSSRWISPLQNYPVTVPGLGPIPLDFRMDHAFEWMNFLLKDPFHEEGLMIALASHFSPDWIFWDVGAYIGMVSGELLRTFPSARCCLFEPNPDTTRRLACLFSGKPNVTIYETALSDRNGRANLQLMAGYSSVASLSPMHGQPTTSIEVELQTGDHFVSTHPDRIPNLIKIDVEGHEVEVLRGCGKLIAMHRPLIVFEHLFLSEDQLKSVTPPGYDLLFIHDKTGACSPVMDRSCSHNAILVPKKSA